MPCCRRVCRNSSISRVCRQSAGAAPKDPEKLKQARQAMQELIQFRRDPRNRFVSDYISNATVEKNQIVNIEVLFGGKAGANEELFKDDAS